MGKHQARDPYFPVTLRCDDVAAATTAYMATSHALKQLLDGKTMPFLLDEDVRDLFCRPTDEQYVSPLERWATTQGVPSPEQWHEAETYLRISYSRLEGVSKHQPLPL